MSNAITQVRPCQNPFSFSHPMQYPVSSTSRTCRKERCFMAGFPIEPSGRIKTLPPYLFAAIDEMKQKAIARGVDIINLGIGDPDLPTPAPIVEQMRQAVGNPKHHHYLPDLQAIPKDVARKAKLMFLNYPNNPTSATASQDFFKRVVEFASEHRIIVCHDAAYSEIYYDGRRPSSFLEADGAKEVGVEFHSLSKTFNMTGWRIGFAVGNKQVLAGLGKVKSNLDSGAFQAVQEAGITALR